MIGLRTASGLYFTLSVLVTMMLAYSQVLAFVFVRRLFKLNTMANKDDQLILAMTKYVECARSENVHVSPMTVTLKFDECAHTSKL